MGGTSASKVAIVTASGGMMGLAVARRLVADGYRLVVNDRDEGRTRDAAASLESAGADVVPIVADVSTRCGATLVTSGAVDTWGRIDLLVNVAGGIKGPIFQPIWQITDQQWDVTLATNLTSAFLMTTAVVSVMMGQLDGCIINTASTSWAGSPAHSHYAAAKAGVVSLTRSAATQLGPYGIRVNVIAPGGTRTRAAMRSAGGALADNGDHVQTIPLRRLNEPEDIGDAVAFLASDQARNISGQVLTIAGGINTAL